MSFSQNWPDIGGDNCTVLGLRLMHRLAMSHIDFLQHNKMYRLHFTSTPYSNQTRVFFSIKKDAYCQHISYATLVSFVAYFGSVPFKFLCMVIFGNIFVMLFGCSESCGIQDFRYTNVTVFGKEIFFLIPHCSIFH